MLVRALCSQTCRKKLIKHLEEMKKEIEKLVIEKGFYNNPEDIPKKLLFAFIELGRAETHGRRVHQKKK